MTIITDEVDPGLLIEIERRLYGDETYTPTIETVLGLPMLMQNWAYMKITDNGDGTWTASVIMRDTYSSCLMTSLD